MRGKVEARMKKEVDDRITPAYAGKSTVAFKRAILYKDHPRVCGEKKKT